MRLIIFILLIGSVIVWAWDYDWGLLGATNPLFVWAKGELGYRWDLYGDPIEWNGGYVRTSATLESYLISYQPSLSLEWGPLSFISLKGKVARDYRLIDRYFTDRPGVDMGGSYSRIAARAGMTLPLMPFLLDGAYNYQIIQSNRTTKLYDEYSDLVLSGPKARQWGWEGKLVNNVWGNYLAGVVGQGWYSEKSVTERAELFGICGFYTFGRLPTKTTGLLGLITGLYHNGAKSWGLSIAANIEFWGRLLQ